MARWTVLSFLAVGVAGAIGSQFVAFEDQAIRIPYEDREAIERGATVYMEYCASCHGRELEGQPNWRRRGPDGRLPAPPHDETGHTWHHPDLQLFEVTKYGTARFAPPGHQTDMIGFEKILTDEEILAALAFIKASWPENVRVRHSAMSETNQ